MKTLRTGKTAGKDRRSYALVAALALIIGLLPAGVSAADGTPSPTEGVSIYDIRKTPADKAASDAENDLSALLSASSKPADDSMSCQGIQVNDLTISGGYISAGAYANNDGEQWYANLLPPGDGSARRFSWTSKQPDDPFSEDYPLTIAVTWADGSKTVVGFLPNQAGEENRPVSEYDLLIENSMFTADAKNGGLVLITSPKDAAWDEAGFDEKFIVKLFDSRGDIIGETSVTGEGSSSIIGGSYETSVIAAAGEPFSIEPAAGSGNETNSPVDVSAVMVSAEAADGAIQEEPVQDVPVSAEQGAADDTVTIQEETGETDNVVLEDTSVVAMNSDEIILLDDDGFEGMGGEIILLDDSGFEGMGGEIVLLDDSAEGELVILDESAPDGGLPQTGENHSLYQWFFGLVLSVSMTTFLLLYCQRLKRGLY